jgi:hypothetical protein
MTTQQVYTRAAQFALCSVSNFRTLAKVGDQSRNKIENLPSWVTDFSQTMQWPLSLEHEKSRFSAAIQDWQAPDWQNDALILSGSLLDRVTITSESQEEMESGEGASHLLQLFLESGPIYHHPEDTLGHTFSRLFITDTIDETRLHKIATMDHSYDVELAFEKLLVGVICFAFYKAKQTVLLEMFLEDPQTILWTSEDLQVSQVHEELSRILHRGKETCKHLVERFLSSTVLLDANMFVALDGANDPFAGSWCFLTGISTLPNYQVHVVSRRLCSGWLRPGSASVYVCLGLLTNLTRHRQLLKRGPKRPPFPARDPKSVPTTLSQPAPAKTHSQTVIPSARLHSD